MQKPSPINRCRRGPRVILLLEAFCLLVLVSITAACLGTQGAGTTDEPGEPLCQECPQGEADTVDPNEITAYLRNDPAFVASVAAGLAGEYAEELRGPPGEQGDPGDQGEQGLQGDQGDPGDPGPAVASSGSRLKAYFWRSSDGARMPTLPFYDSVLDFDCYAMQVSYQDSYQDYRCVPYPLASTGTHYGDDACTTLLIFHATTSCSHGPVPAYAYRYEWTCADGEYYSVHVYRVGDLFTGSQFCYLTDSGCDCRDRETYYEDWEAFVVEEVPMSTFAEITRLYE